MTKHRKQVPHDQVPTKNLDLSEEEQWRLINESGVLKKLPQTRPGDNGSLIGDEESISFADEISNAVLLIIPFSFLLLMFDILIHNQYGKQPSLKVLMERMVPGVPILSVFIFYTSRYKQHRRTQFFLFLLSVIVGPRMIFLLKRGSWLVNMKQCPPLATIWVYTILQLNLGPAVMNLVVVGVWLWWKVIRTLNYMTPLFHPLPSHLIEVINDMCDDSWNK